jgi:hypothetical protein
MVVIVLRLCTRIILPLWRKLMELLGRNFSGPEPGLDDVCKSIKAHP